jgi:hydrogenase/urease accessory protein HupE
MGKILIQYAIIFILGTFVGWAMGSEIRSFRQFALLSAGFSVMILTVSIGNIDQGLVYLAGFFIGEFASWLFRRKQ